MLRELELMRSAEELGAYGAPARQKVCLLNLVCDIIPDMDLNPGSGQFVERGLLPDLELLGESCFTSDDAVAATLPEPKHQERSPAYGMTIRKRLSGQTTEAEIEIGGRLCTLVKHGEWWGSRQNFELLPGPVKVRVTGLNENDVISLQSKLIPWLESMVDRTMISGYKTFEPVTDPNHYAGMKPGPNGQRSKAFTIYLPVSETLQFSECLDRFLVESGLALGEGINTGTLDDRSRVKSRSRRVSLVRDTWPLTRALSEDGLTGFMLDKQLSDRLLTRFANNLRHIEEAANIQSGSLAIDRCGFLMCFPPEGYKYIHRHDIHGSDILGYVSEKTQSRSSPRTDLYRLYELAGLDPVDAVIESPEIREVARLCDEGILRHVRSQSDLLALLDAMPELDSNKRERLKAIASQLDRGSLKDAGFSHMAGGDPLPAHLGYEPLLVIDTYVESLLRVDPSISRSEALRLVREAVENALERSSVEGREVLVKNLFSREPVRALAANGALKRHFEKSPGQFARSVRGGICSLIVLTHGARAWWLDE